MGVTMPALENKRHERFCREYVIDHNGTQAAIRTGYSEKTANEQSSRLLTNANINKRIEELDGDVFDKLGITTEKIVSEYAKLAFGNSEEIFDWTEITRTNKDGDEYNCAVVMLKRKEDIPKHMLASIQSIEETNNGLRIKLYDKKSALDSLSKIKGMFIEQVKHSGEIEHKHGLSDELKNLLDETYNE
jgi:phage terminase small subunit